MSEMLEFTLDKFTFRVATDRLYSPAGLWAKEDGGAITIGLSDFLQQRSGDVAFAEVKPAGTVLKPEAELALLETIKVNLELPAPISGTIAEVNPLLEDAPDKINQDPYGEGWLVKLTPSHWAEESKSLIPPEKFLEKTRLEAEEEAKKL